MKQYAVAGHPLGHSLSPVLFNAAFQALNLDCQYGKRDVTADELGLLVEEMRTGTLQGMSVTLPYKEKIMDFLDGLTLEAEVIGAVNIVYRSGDKIFGGNTDWLGFAEALAKHVNVTNKNILVYGAGGAARACLYALKQLPCTVFLTNRTQEKGTSLAKEFGVTFIDADSLPPVDIFINATSASLKSSTILVSEEWLSGVSLVFDLMYGETALNIQAKKIGVSTIDAKEMLLYQAVRQFEIFTDKQAPVEVMRKALGISVRNR